MAPHLRELISIIEAVKGEERTIDDAEKLFKSWQDMYQRRTSVKVSRPVPKLLELLVRSSAISSVINIRTTTCV